MNFNDYKRNRIGTILYDCEMKDSNTKYISVKELDKILADEMRMIREKEENEKKNCPHVFVYIYYRIYRIIFSDKNRINTTVV